jgi:hypothetical protein
MYSEQPGKTEGISHQNGKIKTESPSMVRLLTAFYKNFGLPKLGVL